MSCRHVDTPKKYEAANQRENANGTMAQWHDGTLQCLKMPKLPIFILKPVKSHRFILIDIKSSRGVSTFATTPLLYLPPKILI